MVVAMTAVLVMQMAGNDIVHVIAMGDGVMSALRVMAVYLFVAFARVI
jgi:hypothetical protein